MTVFATRFCHGIQTSRIKYDSGAVESDLSTQIARLAAKGLMTSYLASAPGARSHAEVSPYHGFSALDDQVFCLLASRRSRISP